MISDITAETDKGPCRDINQDAVYVDCDDKMGIFVVADGMGGHSDGEKASSAVVEELSIWWNSIKKYIGEFSAEQLGNDCAGSLRYINGKLHEEFANNGKIGGCTIAILIVVNNVFLTISAGDSRVYAFDGNKLMQLTVDDVWETLPGVQEQYTREALANDERYGKLTEAVGAYDELNIRQGKGEISAPCTFFLCSDGVYKFVSHDQLEKVFKEKNKSSDASQLVQRIKRKVLKGGAGDNYSCIICKTEC